jgi:hypothetical protein
MNTRNRKQLYLPNSNLSAFQKGTMFIAIKLLNSLAITIQSLKEYRINFKNKLSLYLMNNSFNAVSEYVEYNIIN